MSANTDAVEAFIHHFNERDLDGFVEVLDPGVVIESMRGPRRGVEEARDWADRKPGGVQQHVEIEELRENGERVVALTRRKWFWAGTDDLAGDDAMAHLFTLRDGRVLRWQPFEDRAAALRAAGLG